MTTVERINNYLVNGGLFNPELMEHDKVSELLRDCRTEIQELAVKAGSYTLPPHIQAEITASENKIEDLKDCLRDAEQRHAHIKPLWEAGVTAYSICKQERDLMHRRLIALSKQLWKTRWMSDICSPATTEDKRQLEEYEQLVGIAAEINSGNFEGVDKL